MTELYTKIVGVSFDDHQENIKKVVAGQELFWEREPSNPYDLNAVAVFADDEMKHALGHLNQRVAEHWTVRAAMGMRQRIFVERLTGGKEGKSMLGVNVRLEIQG